MKKNETSEEHAHANPKRTSSKTQNSSERSPIRCKKAKTRGKSNKTLRKIDPVVGKKVSVKGVKKNRKYQFKLPATMIGYVDVGKKVEELEHFGGQSSTINLKNKGVGTASAGKSNVSDKDSERCKSHPRLKLKMKRLTTKLNNADTVCKADSSMNSISNYKHSNSSSKSSDNIDAKSVCDLTSHNGSKEEAGPLFSKKEMFPFDSSSSSSSDASSKVFSFASSCGSDADSDSQQSVKKLASNQSGFRGKVLYPNFSSDSDQKSKVSHSSESLEAMSSVSDRSCSPTDLKIAHNRSGSPTVKSASMSQVENCISAEYNMELLVKKLQPKRLTSFSEFEGYYFDKEARFSNIDPSRMYSTATDRDLKFAHVSPSEEQMVEFISEMMHHPDFIGLCPLIVKWIVAEIKTKKCLSRNQIKHKVKKNSMFLKVIGNVII